MNKDEAALYLGISTRTLGRYVRDGKLEPTFRTSIFQSRMLDDSAMLLVVF